MSSKGYFRRVYEAITNPLFGVPEKPTEIKKTGTAILGAVEQNYGIYQVPSFRDLVTTFWNDSVLREAIQDFGEQVVSSGVFYTCNNEYTVKLPVFKDGQRIGETTALQAIKDWCEQNNIEEKILEIAIELKAFGNSFWRISDNGFSKIPIEAVWHMIRVDPNIPLQEKYHMQLVPIYGGVVVPYGEFIHFRVYVTGYKAPFGIGMLHSLLARPTMTDGTYCPSVYDVRLSMRASLDEGFRKFSFGNELWVFEGLSEDKLDELGTTITTMKSTGNRIATNVRGKIELAVPERTQSYDKFIENMRNEFYMSLGDPTLKLGLEMGFTKSTSETAADAFKVKLFTMRQTIKHHFEGLFVQILNKLGFDGKLANIQMHFEKQETPVYDSKEIFGAVDRGVLTPDEARGLLAKYGKWDISGKIEGGDKPRMGIGMFKGKQPFATNTAVSDSKVKEEGVAMVIHEDYRPPRVVITELSDSLGGYNKRGDIYLDTLAISSGYPKDLLVAHERLEHDLVVKQNVPYKKAHKIATEYEKILALDEGMDWEGINKIYQDVLPKIKDRGSIDPSDIVKSSEDEYKKEVSNLDMSIKKKKLEMLDKLLKDGENS